MTESNKRVYCINQQQGFLQLVPFHGLELSYGTTRGFGQPHDQAQIVRRSNNKQCKSKERERVMTESNKRVYCINQRQGFLQLVPFHILELSYGTTRGFGQPHDQAQIVTRSNIKQCKSKERESMTESNKRVYCVGKRQRFLQLVPFHGLELSYGTTRGFGQPHNQTQRVTRSNIRQC